MDALTLLKQDHRTVDALFKKFEKLGDGAAKAKRKLVDQMIKELSIHAAIEEQIFYPTIRKAIPKIEDNVLEGLEEHHIVKWTLSELEKLAPDAERFEAKVTVLIESVRHHVKEEEQEMFPKIRKAIKPPELKAMGALMEKAKKTAPKRAHPRSPDAPPGNLVAGPVAAAMDKGMEMIQSLKDRVSDGVSSATH